MRANAFALMNVVRTAAGLPQFVRAPAVDGTAQAHAQYVVANGSLGTEEAPSRPCFTGVSFTQRLADAGVAVAEVAGQRMHSEIVIAYTNPAGVELQPWDMVNNALHNVYGRMLLLDPRALQIGLGFSARPAGPQRALVLDSVLPPGTPVDGSAWVVWPRDGATGLPTAMGPSDMKPLAAGVTEGYPVSLQTMAALQVSRFVLTRASDGAVVAATLLTAATDRNAFLARGEAALVPHAPLVAGTTYRVEVDASVAGNAVHKVWSFTTAP